MLTPALVLAAVAHSATFTSLDALITPSHYQHGRISPALHYSNGGDDGETYFSPLPIRRPLRRRRRTERLPQHRQEVMAPMSTKSTEAEARPSRRIPRRAMPHVKNSSNEEAATRAGYIIRETQLSTRERKRDNGQQQMADNLIRVKGPSKPLDVHVRNRPRNELDEFLDRPVPWRGASRVTFKATRKASKAIVSKPMASLAEYMTQPVSQYSLLSFHDAEGPTDSNNANANNPRSRRWLVRRLSSEEAQGYISNSNALSSENDEVMDESNLFRLAVPLLPLIGWDLTPVIDLEVIPPKIVNISNNGVSAVDPVETETAHKASDDSSDTSQSSQSEWAPLRGIRKRINSHEDDTCGDTSGSPPVVKIRSLRVSLLSTQEEVKQVMSNKNNQISQRDSKMQKEAIEMVGKVEEWLRPHISFEAELSWTDGASASGTSEGDSSSTVTVSSTAITSLTIPKIPSDIIRKTVPSAFFVKRLGATLTSRALAICLPRFLRQLEKDYDRWS